MIVTIEFKQEIDLKEVLSEILGGYIITSEEAENPELFVKNHIDSLIEDCIDGIGNQVRNIKYEDNYRKQIKDELKEDYVLDYIKEFFNN